MRDRGQGKNVEYCILRHMLYTDPTDKTSVERGIAETRKALDVAAAKYDQGLVPNPGDRKAIDRSKAALRVIWALWKRI